MRIEIFRGSLLDVPDVEALVVPANKQLTLGWGSQASPNLLQLSWRGRVREPFRCRSELRMPARFGQG